MSEVIVDFKDIQKTLEPIFEGKIVRIVLAKDQAIISLNDNS